MKKLAYFLFISICLTGCQKCKKKQPEPVVYTNGSFNQSVKNYGVFKPGTYWVYQDSVSGVLDSVWVYQYAETTDTIENPTNTFNVCPVYLYRTFSSKFRTNNYFEYNTAFEYAITPGSTVEQSVVDSASGYLGRIVFLKSLFKLNESFGNYLTFDIINLNQVQDNYLLKNGVLVNGVLKYHHTHDWTNHYVINYQPYPNKTYQYLAPNIGLVRKEIIDSNKVWNLIRYNIVQ